MVHQAAAEALNKDRPISGSLALLPSLSYVNLPGVFTRPRVDLDTSFCCEVFSKSTSIVTFLCDISLVNYNIYSELLKEFNYLQGKIFLSKKQMLILNELD